MKGGTTHGQSTVCRCAGPSRRVSGCDEFDARRVSASRPALRGSVPGAYGVVAPRWETPDRPPVERVQELPPADAGRPAVLPAYLPEDVQPPGGPGPPVRHGPEQGQPVDPRAFARAAGRSAYPR